MSKASPALKHPPEKAAAGSCGRTRAPRALARRRRRRGAVVPVPELDAGGAVGALDAAVPLRAALHLSGGPSPDEIQVTSEGLPSFGAGSL